MSRVKGNECMKGGQCDQSEWESDLEEVVEGGRGQVMFYFIGYVK